MVHAHALATLALLPLAAAAGANCPPKLVSCSSAALAADPCCVPRAGLWLFKQRFEPDAGDDGKWGINNVDVLECDGTQPSQPTNPKLSHEEIGLRCARAGFDADQAEAAWAQSEVGESVEEVWERVWNTDGRFVSCICDGDPSRFFAALDRLHAYLPTGSWLEEAGITPSPDVHYRRSDMAAALSTQGHTPVLLCANATLTGVVYPVHVVGDLGSFVPAKQGVEEGNCPAEDIIYPPAAVLPTPTSTWDPIFRPTMRAITLTHDESRQVKYDDEEDAAVAKKKLSFFKDRDAMRMRGEHGHEQYARDEL